jgi:hypothetical protein
MSDRNGKPDTPAYPGSAVRPIPISRVDPQTLEALRKRALAQPWANGAGMLASTPTVFVCLRDEQMARKLARHAALVLAWNWNLDFGRVLSFTLFAGKHQDLQGPAFIPYEDEWVKRLLTDGRLHIVLGTASRFIQAFEADFIRGPESHISRSGLEHIASIPDEAILHHWPSAVFGLLEYRSDNGVYSNLISPADRVQISWMNTIRWMANANKELAQQAGFVVRQAFLEGEAKHMTPIAYDILRLFVDGRHSPTALADETFKVVHENRLAAEVGQAAAAMLLTDMSYLYHKLSLVGPETALLRNWLFLAAATSSQAQDGRALTWFDTTQSAMGLSHLKSLPLDLHWIGERAPDYHLRYWEAPRINAGFFLTSRDIPIAPPELHPEQLSLSPEFDKAAAAEMIGNLLAETSACRKWSIPWGATVELHAGIFEYAQIYEVDREFHVKLVNAKGEFGLLSVNPQERTWSTPYLQWADSEGADTALRILVAAVLRDFVVIEDRESVFASRPLAAGSRRDKRDGPRVIYIPRIRYNRDPNVVKAESQLELRTRTPHLVSPHLRRSAECSDAQRRLAAAYGFTVPPGHTFVRKHTRGKQEDGPSASPAIYRSRSALNAMYDVVTGTLGGVVEWFKFEKDVSKLMKRLGFQVEHIGAHRHDDRGVDVFALSLDEKEGWAVQCKCWRPDRPVGPDVVRELLGAISAYPDGTKGMLVTTSRFTSGAATLAKESGVMLIDGDEFASLLGDVPPVGQ